MKDLRSFCQLLGVTTMLLTTMLLTSTFSSQAAFAAESKQVSTAENSVQLPLKIAQTIDLLKTKIPSLQEYNFVRLAKDGDSVYSPHDITVILNKFDEEYRTDNVFRFNPQTESIEFFTLDGNLAPLTEQMSDQKAIEIASKLLTEVMGENGYTPLKVWRETVKGPHPFVLPPKINFKKMTDDPNVATYIQVALDSKGSLHAFNKKTRSVQWDQWYNADIEKRAVPKSN